MVFRLYNSVNGYKFVLTNEESQAATSANDVEIGENNLTNVLFLSFSDR